MTRINNEQSDLTTDEFLRIIKYDRCVQKFRAAEKNKTKILRGELLNE